jgi:hypothetical protein
MKQAEQEPDRAQHSAEDDKDRERPPHEQLAAALQALRMLTVPMMLVHIRIVGGRARPINGDSARCAILCA